MWNRHLAIGLGALGLLAGISTPVWADSVKAAAAHATITSYTGPETCTRCHSGQAAEVFHSVHYQWTGPTPNVTNIAGNSGKADTGFNTYCGTIISGPYANCTSCHVAYGKRPTSVMDTTQLNNVDCLMCHQDKYKRKWAAPTAVSSFTGIDGVTRQWTLPVEDANGGFNYTIDEAAMGISALEAVRTVHLPTRSSCLRCHAYAGGADCTKRGDLSSASASPTTAIDVHLSPQGGNLSCQSCHEFDRHRVKGRGLDLRENDRPGFMDCSGCHSATPHTDARYNTHAAHIACQTCHIPTYAKSMSTETARTWLGKVWSAGLLGGQGGWKPEETRAANLTPTYRWYDGTSQVYAYGQVPTLNTKGQYEFASPNGSVASSVAKIYPMKEHTSNAAMHDANGIIIPHSTFKFFVTGDFNQAVADGMAFAGLSGSWHLVNTHTYQTINHGVALKASALTCGSCHTYYSSGQPVRMNLKTDLGYAMKGTETTTCRQCHGAENMPNFSRVHSIHVTEEGYDCYRCHNFSRPERGLRIQSSTDPDGDKVTAAFDNCPNVANTNQADQDHDGIGDACDLCPLVYGQGTVDSDHDGHADTCDNCPNVANADQKDTDYDGIGDACDDDDDGDGKPDAGDNCPLFANPSQRDTDGDGLGEACDACPNTIPGLAVDASGCSVFIKGDFDRDGDVDMEDFGHLQLCMSGANIPQTDPACADARLDGDTDVDNGDVTLFKLCLTASFIPANPACAQ